MTLPQGTQRVGAASLSRTADVQYNGAVTTNALFIMIISLLVISAVISPALAAGTSKSGYITVGLAPVADFDANYAYDVVPATVAFQDRSTGTTPLTYIWDFGDGTSSKLQNPVHTYIRQGVYTVTLIVMNNYGSDTETKTNFIAVGLAPRAAFSASPTSGNAPLAVGFTDQSAGNPDTWSWNFGDGGSSTLQHPVHTYREGGYYTVILTVSNKYGSSSVSKPHLIRVNPALNAEFVAEPRSGNTPLSVWFTDRSTGDPESWSWDFGDGTTSSEQNPVHTYKTAGTTSTNAFTVTLTIRNRNGDDSEQKVNYITVTQAPVAEFTVDERWGKAPFTVKFRDLSLGKPTSWRWEFGDGTTSTEQHPVHVYPYEGAYDVRLTVANKYGSDSLLKTGSSSLKESKGIAPATTATITAQVTSPASMATEPAALANMTAAETLPAATRAPVHPLIPVVTLALIMTAHAFMKRN